MKKRAEKQKSHEHKIVVLFLIGVFVICGMVLLKDARVIGYATLSEQKIEIMNKQSYAAVNDPWTIRFKTQGEGDLQISDIKEAFYDITPLQIRCGDQLFNYEEQGDMLVVKDYKCDLVSTITTEIRQEGLQTLKLKFGNKVYAENTAITKEKI
jgi:hypothetical protein